MKNIPLKTMASVIILMAQFGATQILFADDVRQEDNSSVANTLDAEFSSAMTNRAGMTIEIIDRLREEAKTQGLIGWEKELTTALNNASSEAFLAAYNTKTNYQAVVLALNGISFDKQALVDSFNAGGAPSLSAKSGAPSLAGRLPDSAYKNLVYTPVTPCRIVSTTGESEGKIRAGTSRSYRAHGTGGIIGPQGGDPSGCTPNGNKDAFGYLFNITVHQVNQGHVRIYPAHETNTITSIVNFIPGAAIANSTIVKTTHTGGKDFKIFAARDAHVIVDVMGYFDKPEKVMPDTYIARSASKVIAGDSFDSMKSPNCPSGYRLISGGMQADTLNVQVSGSYPDTNVSGANLSASKWRCRAHNTHGNPSKFSCYSICLRIPGK